MQGFCLVEGLLKRGNRMDGYMRTHKNVKYYCQNLTLAGRCIQSGKRVALRSLTTTSEAFRPKILAVTA